MPLWDFPFKGVAITFSGGFSTTPSRGEWLLSALEKGMLSSSSLSGPYAESRNQGFFNSPLKLKSLS